MEFAFPIASASEETPETGRLGKWNEKQSKEL